MAASHFAEPTKWVSRRTTGAGANQFFAPHATLFLVLLKSKPVTILEADYDARAASD